MSVALTKWAGKNPEFFITVLDRKPQNIRLLALRMLDWDSRENLLAQKRRFETAIRQYPNSPTARAWRWETYH